MKRTRRIEIVRYTRRVHPSVGDGADAFAAAEEQAVALLLKAADTPPPAPEAGCDCARRLGEAPPPVTRPGLLRRLAGWLPWG